MKLDKALKRIAETKSDHPELRRAARDIGHELRRERLHLLEALRTELAIFSDEDVTEFVKGYREALLDMLFGFCVSLKGY